MAEYEDDYEDTFVSEKWQKLHRNVMLRATEALDRLCRRIIHAKTFYPSGPVARSLRDLALTASVFDPALFSYALKIQQITRSIAEKHTKWVRRRSQLPPLSPLHNQKNKNKKTPEKSTTPGKKDTNALDSKARGIGGKGEGGGRAGGEGLLGVLGPNCELWQLESGGFVSLLDLLSSTLRKLAHTVKKLRENSSFQAFVIRNRVPGASFALIWTLIARTWLYNRMVRILTVRLLGGQAGYYWIVSNGLLRAFNYLVVPAVLYTAYSKTQRAFLRRLEEQQRQLDTLLRLWHVCISNIDRARQHSTKAPHNRTLSSRNKSLVTWMMEKVPPALDSSFWYRSNDRLNLLKVCLDIAYSTINVWDRYFGTAWSAIPLMSIVMAYYILRPHRAAYRASYLLSAPDMALVNKIWQTLDSRIMNWILWIFLRKKHQLHIQRIRVDGALHHDAAHSGSRASIDSLETEGEGGPSGRKLQWSQHMLSCESVEPTAGDTSPNPLIRFWVACIDDLDFVKRGQSSVPIVIYVHGGGFVGAFPATERQLIAKWADDTRALFVHIDYSVSPEAKFPTALDECYAVYRYVLEGKLGVEASSIVLVGESNGGGLACGVCMRAIEDEIKVPNGLVLGYPVLNLEPSLTPSRSLFMMDPVVPMNLIRQCRSSYLPSKHEDKGTDLEDLTQNAYVSPLLANNLVLCKFPPTDIQVGTFDPFLDDSIYFAHRLTANGVRCRLRRFRNVPHAFWCFQPTLKESAQGIHLAGEWMRSYTVRGSTNIEDPHRAAAYDSDG
ncbi:hypothetical protein AAMO2058_000366400 [Amorphochlora amoebiformis]